MSISEIIVVVGQFFLSLSLLIILHELGHYVPAKLFKTRVEKFFLFFDVKFALFRKKIGETVYGIGWLPLGGYVKISGMIDESMDRKQLSRAPQPWEFRSKPAWQRLIIMLGGVAVNLLLAWVIYIGIAYVWGERYLSVEQMEGGIEVSTFLESEVGLKTGDKIIALDGNPVKSFSDINSYLLLSEEVLIEREGRNITLPIPEDFISKLVDEEPRGLISYRLPFVIAEVPEDSHNKNAMLQKGDMITSIDGKSMRYANEVTNYLNTLGDSIVSVNYLREGEGMHTRLAVKEGKFGVIRAGLSLVDLEKLGFYELSSKEYTFFGSFSAGTRLFFDKFSWFGKQLEKLVNPSTGAYKGLGSFISIAKIFPTAWNWQAFWNITAFLSIMLGVLNLLPIPALDGGHAMFLTYEIIVGRKPSDKFLEYAQMIGFVLLILLFIYAFGNDIYRNFLK